MTQNTSLTEPVHTLAILEKFKELKNKRILVTGVTTIIDQYREPMLV